MSEVTDGASQTILVTECAGRPELWRTDGPDPGTYVFPNGAWVGGTLILFQGSTPDGAAKLGPCAINCTNDKEPFSFHPSGVGAVFADGSVRFLQEDMEIRTFARLRTEAEDLGARLAEAKGVFVIPDYATAALLVGGSGGEGVLLQRRDGELTDPAFYDVGSVDIGAQAGASAGAIVLMLMNDEALSTFQQETNFALTSQAGLTIVNWSADTGASSEPGDVLVWSDTEGLMAEASVGVSGISWDEEENRQYYNSEVTAEQVLAGDVENPHEESLRSEFAEFSAQ
jgi:lipid-binding SYLF domain-containing protein